MSDRYRVAEAEFPASPGVYVVWEEGQATPLYVGVAATQTIKERWRKQTLQDRAGGSALRRTLGVHLGLVERKLSPTRDGTRYYAPEVEHEITSFLLGCEIEFHPCRSAEESHELEETLIVELAPRLNVRRPRIKRTAAEKVVLREAALFFREHVKPAVLRGLEASNRNAALDGKNYVALVEDNLLPGIELAEIRAAFDAAPGHELESKMRAPWSSSALTVNLFAPWLRHLEQLPLADRIDFDELEFESACSNVEEAEMLVSDPRVEAVRELDPDDVPTAALAVALAPCILLTDNRKHFRPLGLPDRPVNEIAVDIYRVSELTTGANGVASLTWITAAGIVEGSKKLVSVIGKEGAVLITLLLVGAAYLYWRSEPGSRFRQGISQITREAGPPLLEAITEHAELNEKVSALAIRPSDESPTALRFVASRLVSGPATLTTAEISSRLSEAGYRFKEAGDYRKQVRVWLTQNDCFFEVHRGHWSLGYHSVPRQIEAA
jgi:hypothetical protein